MDERTLQLITAFAQVVLGEDQPLALTDAIQSQFLMPLQRDIRCKVVQVAADRGVAKQSRSQFKTLGAEAAATSVEEEQERSPRGPRQMSLSPVDAFSEANHQMAPIGFLW